jgi:radical SAM protein with 4Fe4S-binding SPASM domain
MPNQPLSARVNIRASEKNVPLSVLIELTNACNLNCYYCYQRHSRKTGELNTSQWVRIFGQLAGAGALYLVLSGGEPFTRPDIFDLISEARKHDFAVGLISNGLLIDDRAADRLMGLGILDIGISFHAANADLHDELSGFPGSFAHARDAAITLRKRNIKIAIKHTVSTRNFGQYRALQKMAGELDCLFECESIVLPDTRGTVSPFALTQEQHARFLRDMGATFRPETCGDRDNLHCDAGRSVAGILPDGTVVPCIQLPLALGNLTRQSFMEIWDGRPAREFRESEQQVDTACVQCELHGFCGRCHGLAWWETGRWQGPSPGLCRRAKAAKEILNSKS